MSLYSIEHEGVLSALEPRSFSEVKIRERQNLQALLRDNISVISPDLLVISEEYSNWQESLRRVDLLAIDRDANLVVIELKCLEDGGHMELQAIRYAAMLAMLDFEAVVDAYEKFLQRLEIRERLQIDTSDARNKLLCFLGEMNPEEVNISKTPRIILASPGFSKEITTTVLWLNDRGLDIRCVEIRPYLIDARKYLDIEQVIPVQSADDFVVKMREKSNKAERQILTKRRGRSLSTLLAAGILKTGMDLHLIRSPRPGMDIPDERAKKATFMGGQEAQWHFDNEVYSLSGLCRVICEKFGGDIGSGAFAGPDYWAIEGDTHSLSERAKLVESAN